MLAHVALRVARSVTLLVALWFAATGAADEPARVESQSSLGPLVADAIAPLMAEWIVASRDAAVAAGVEPIPHQVRVALQGYVPDAVLDLVRWRESGGDAFTLQQSAIHFGDVPAMTLDHVIVFKSRDDALADPKLWAHEIKHVMQFAEWGVRGFATRYLEDYEAVEFEAAEFRWQFMKQAGLIPGLGNDQTE